MSRAGRRELERIGRIYRLYEIKTDPVWNVFGELWVESALAGSITQDESQSVSSATGNPTLPRASTTMTPLPREKAPVRHGPLAPKVTDPQTNRQANSFVGCGGGRATSAATVNEAGGRSAAHLAGAEKCGRHFRGNEQT